MSEFEKQIIVTPEVQRYKQAMGSLSPIKVSEMLNSPLHRVQQNIARYFEQPMLNEWDTAVWLMSRRLGKSYLATKIMVTLLLTQGSLISLCSHSTSLSDETFNNILKDLSSIPLVKDKIKAYKKEGIIEIPSFDTRVITASYLNSQSRFVGKSNNWLFFDEFALVPANYQEEILNLVTPTLTTYGRNEEGIANGKTVFLTTPRGIVTGSPLGLKYLAGEQGEKGHLSFKHTIYDSPFLTDTEIEQLRQATPEDVWQQEYMVNFTKTSVNTFRNFNKDKHMIHISNEFLKDIIPFCDFIIALDWGQIDGSSASFILYNNKTETYYVFDEIYVKETVNYDFIKMFKAKAEEWCEILDFTFDNILFFSDASAKEASNLANQKFGIGFHKARNKMFEGTDYVNQLFQGKGDAKVPNLYISEKCHMTQYMVEYCEFKTVNGQLTPQFARDKGIYKSHFDLAICLVYGTYTHNKTQHNHLIIS